MEKSELFENDEIKQKSQTLFWRKTIWQSAGQISANRFRGCRLTFNLSKFSFPWDYNAWNARVDANNKRSSKRTKCFSDNLCFPNLLGEETPRPRYVIVPVALMISPRRRPHAPSHAKSWLRACSLWYYQFVLFHLFITSSVNQNALCSTRKRLVWLCLNVPLRSRQNSCFESSYSLNIK